MSAETFQLVAVIIIRRAFCIFVLFDSNSNNYLSFYSIPRVEVEMLICVKLHVGASFTVSFAKDRSCFTTKHFPLK